MTNLLSQKIKEVSFFSMIMVVVLHCYNLDAKVGGLIIEQPKDFNWFIQTFISYGVTRIAVPLFFLISGYLFFLGFKNSKNEITNKVKKRIRTLVVPYFFWVLFGILFYFVLQSIPQLHQFFTNKLIKDYSSLDWLNVVFVKIIPYQLWFLRDLIVMVFLSPIIYFVIKKINYFFLLVTLPFWILNQDNLVFTSEALLFFSIGSFLALENAELLEKKTINSYLFLSIWIVILLLKTFSEFYFERGSLPVVLLLKSSILVGIYAFWSWYDNLIKNNQNRFIRFNPIMNFSFFLYVFHEPTLTIIKKVLFKVFGSFENKHLFIYLLSPFATIFICVFVGITIKKVIPNFYNLITGNR